MSIVTQITYAEPTYTKVTVQEIFEALKKNGFEHLRGVWAKGDGKLIVGGCILQQGAMNLGVRTIDTPTSLYEVLNRFKVSKTSRWAQHPVTKHTLLEIDRGAGSVIVRWNDAFSAKGVWVLPTYSDVIDMAYEVLKPFFKKEVRLEAYEWAYKRKD